MEHSRALRRVGSKWGVSVYSWCAKSLYRYVSLFSIWVCAQGPGASRQCLWRCSYLDPTQLTLTQRPTKQFTPANSCLVANGSRTCDTLSYLAYMTQKFTTSEPYAYKTGVYDVMDQPLILHRHVLNWVKDDCISVHHPSSNRVTFICLCRCDSSHSLL